jgi:regulation of enolase protein 1 (concanavalin A-like superfamily)
MVRYLIEIKYAESKEVEEVVLETDRLDWSMEQYQRNRQPFTWKVIEENLPLSLSHKMGKPFPTEEVA